ncbi:DUF72 domain-containing protein [Shinella daejeonensis]|uniref:DUF72 domain-containing protein n=1 Tax=Shinella daejeonensis TaxID=659017 RepID=UPI0020C7EEE0|nr:DUF72 domain-containing protein [Shinella daejeonensis]MCP8893376.1 DUF72 domain-containing protein [Shinella daejeonensis]
MSTSGTIRTGIGGWTFAPWEGTFYPDKLPKTRQLQFAGQELATIEINGTYYGSQKPETFAKWAADVPDGFVFSLKASRFTTNRKILSQSSESIEKFLGQGLTELGDRLGPILWQFAPTKAFDPEDFEGFLKLLPKSRDGLPLRHALEVRHDSFKVPEFAALARKCGAAIVYAHHPAYPEIADVTADFVYARLQQGSDEIETCYAPAALDAWAGRLEDWAKGGEPADLPRIDPGTRPARQPRDVFAFFITSGKVNAPNGARALQRKVA